MFTVFWTIWSVICLIFAQIRIKPFMHRDGHPKFSDNKKTFQRCTTFICVSWMVMMLIFYPLLENIILTSEKLGNAMNILLWLNTRKDETIELSLTTYSLSETEFSRAVDLDFLM